MSHLVRLWFPGDPDWSRFEHFGRVVVSLKKAALTKKEMV